MSIGVGGGMIGGGRALGSSPNPTCRRMRRMTIASSMKAIIRIIEGISGEVETADIGWADLVAISTITSTAPRAYDLGDRAVRMNKAVVYGGPHVTFLPAEALEHGHFVIRGEGEESFPELVEALETGRDLTSITGLSFLREGELKNNPPRNLMEDLDRLPVPDFSLVRGWNRAKSVVPIATSRGCPYNCKFCSVVPMFGRRIRQYKKLLQSEIVSKARLRFGELAMQAPRPEAVFLADTVDDPYRLFFEAFLNRLGIKVQTVAVGSYLQEAGQNLHLEMEEKLRALKSRTGVLMVPFIEGVESIGLKGRAHLKALMDKLEFTLPESVRQLFLDIDLGKNSLYQEAVELGLIFSGNLRRIRRAYRFALEEAGL